MVKQIAVAYDDLAATLRTMAQQIKDGKSHTLTAKLSAAIDDFKKNGSW